MPSRYLKWFCTHDCLRFLPNAGEKGKRETDRKFYMNVRSSWKDEYASMQVFVSANPAIVLNPNEISIPQEFKEEFYLRFDRIRGAIVDAHYSDVPYDIEALCHQYLQIERETIALLGIDSIAMPKDLYSFLHTPREGLVRILYNGLFDLLQGKTTVEVFERRCLEDLRNSSADLYRLGYEWWAGLVILKLLEPDRAYGVYLDDEYRPFLAELKEISFGRQAHHPTMRIPEFVLHSRKLDKLVAVKMSIVKELETYAERYKPPVRPKKRTGDTSFSLDSRLMMLSFMSSETDIPIIAETYDRTLTSPDFMIEFITKDELEDPGALDEVQHHLNFMKPRLGMSLIVIDQESTGELAGMPKTILPVIAGFDQEKLQPVISALA
jgi:hypothetical protein